MPIGLGKYQNEPYKPVRVNLKPKEKNLNKKALGFTRELLSE